MGFRGFQGSDLLVGSGFRFLAVGSLQLAHEAVRALKSTMGFRVLRSRKSNVVRSSGTLLSVVA